MTAAFLSGPQGNNRWFTGPVNVTLVATDIDGPSDVASTTYTVDGGSATDYTAPFTVSDDGIHTVQFGSVDQAGNVEMPRPTQMINIDGTPPGVSCAASPNSLWPPNGTPARVTVSGSITDATSGLDPTSVRYAVTDKYGQVQPSGGVTIGTGGSYSFGVLLVASRLGTDPDGRTYNIKVSGKDMAGNVGSCSVVVTVPHDQGH